MKIFVTGADGFIGSHLVEKLIKLGHNELNVFFENIIYIFIKILIIFYSINFFII